VSEKESHHHTEREIIIVRRRSDGDGDGHHGGVWKIAYADFMTAMMAFFLVMWLVNAANEETKASVASYFNPIKLMDEKPSERSVQDVGESSEGSASQPAAKTQGEGESEGAQTETGQDQHTAAGEETEFSQSDFFENPYSVLAEIALETGRQTNISDAGEGGAQTSGPATGASGGEAYRDPFDPDFWSQQLQATTTTQTADDTTAEIAAAPPLPDITITEPDVQAAPASQVVAPPLPQDRPEPADTAQGAADAAAAQNAAQASAEAESLRDTLGQALGGINGKLAEGLEVTPAEGGLLISLTDQLEYPMFNVGSAVPERDLVLAMEQIGRLLSERDGAVAIRGHTDARPFATGDNNNWRLSTDRAHSAYYMLVRGGLGEERIVQVSGFADRKLKLPDDPFNDANRRIEILVQGEGL
jgi:chemotaxis protein MotB